MRAQSTQVRFAGGPVAHGLRSSWFPFLKARGHDHLAGSAGLAGRHPGGKRKGPVNLSVVVPVFNEVESVRLLADRVGEALEGFDEWELLFVDDGSRDGTPDVVAELAANDRRIKLVRLARNYGQTAAMQAGFDQSSGAVVVSMDGDLQNDPADIPRLVAKLAEGHDLVSGYRVRRQDALLRRKAPSWIANHLIRAFTGVKIRDNGCSLKAYRREILDRVHLYADMHRFIPAMAAATAGARIAEIPVRHHARKFGRSKYGMTRVAKVAADLLTITMIRSFRERPLVMFAAGSVGAWLLGTVFAFASVVAFVDFRVEKALSVVFPGVAMLWLGLGGYLLLLGLIAEVALSKQRRGWSEPVPLAHDGFQSRRVGAPTGPLPW